MREFGIQIRMLMPVIAIALMCLCSCGERSEPGNDKWIATTERSKQGQSQKGAPIPIWASATGTDQYGSWADLTVTGNGETAVQRFRWILPGTFIMGSPDNEEREIKEVQHKVTITTGYWLADSECTQRMWIAVMGTNPSKFRPEGGKGLDLPVERVDYEDICDQTAGFLTKLNTISKGLQARLPTEAEWEYACRAGTTTPFSFGANISTEQVNYNGDLPYAGAAKGPFRQTTVAVRSLPANPWGLYEMHGNVGEWCQDWYGDYPIGDQVDPTGSDHHVFGVVRGGHWDGSAGICRSACRRNPSPLRRDRDRGFRLSAGQR